MCGEGYIKKTYCDLFALFMNITSLDLNFKKA